MESVHRRYAAWRAMESLVSAAENELYEVLRCKETPEPELVYRVRRLRAESNHLFNEFIAEADRSATGLSWKSQAQE